MKIINAKLILTGHSRATTIPRDMIEYQGGCKDGRIIMRVLSEAERHQLENAERQSE